MNKHREALIAKLEGYCQSAVEQIRTDGEQTSYWRGVLFGLELALLEIRNEPTPLDNGDAIDEKINDLVSHKFDDLMALYQTPIPRDLLIYNVQIMRLELLSAIRACRNDNMPDR